MMIPADELKITARGVAFLNIGSVIEAVGNSVKLTNYLAGILRGSKKRMLIRRGLQDASMFECTMAIRDPLVAKPQLGVVTIVNFSNVPVRTLERTNDVKVANEKVTDISLECFHVHQRRQADLGQYR